MADTVGTNPDNSKRDSVRRAVSLDCQVLYEQWDGPVSLAVKDLSLRGVWVETPLPIEVGERVSVSLTPPGWPLPIPLETSAVVARVDMPRRKSDRREPGMGLAFTNLGGHERRLLEEVLCRLPLRLPSERLDI